MKNIRCFITLLCAFCTILPASLSAGTRFDSLCAQSDLMVSGHVVQHRIDPVAGPDSKLHCEIDFVVYMMCAETDRYPDLLKVLLPGDTLKGLSYFTGSANDTAGLNRWLQLPLMRDTTTGSGWRLTDNNFRSGIFGDTATGGCNRFVNYIYNEYGVVQQKFTHKAMWGYTSFITLDGTLREQWKYKRRGEKYTEVRTKYFADGRKNCKVRAKQSLDRNGVRIVAWTFRQNGKRTLHQQKTGVYD